MSSMFFNLLKVCAETIKTGNHYLPNINGSHCIKILKGNGTSFHPYTVVTRPTMNVNVHDAYSGSCLTSMMELLTACSHSHVLPHTVQI